MFKFICLKCLNEWFLNKDDWYDIIYEMGL